MRTDQRRKRLAAGLLLFSLCILGTTGFNANARRRHNPIPHPQQQAGPTATANHRGSPEVVVGQTRTFSSLGNNRAGNTNEQEEVQTIGRDVVVGQTRTFSSPGNNRKGNNKEQEVPQAIERNNDDNKPKKRNFAKRFGNRARAGNSNTNERKKEVPTKRTFFSPRTKAVEEETEEEEEAVVTTRSSQPFHAVRAGDNSASGAVIHRGGVPLSIRKNGRADSDEEEDEKEPRFHGVGLGRASNTRGVRRQPGNRGGFGGRKHRDNHNNDNRKQRRGLKGFKQQTRTDGGGLGKIKGKVKGRKGVNPIECNARKGKICKKADAEDRAGEQRGEFRLTKEGDVDPYIRPDFTLADVYEGEELELNAALSKYRAESPHIYYGAEKRFFSMPQASVIPTTSGLTTKTIDVGLGQPQDKQGAAAAKGTPKKALPEFDDHEPQTIPQFVPRAIPNRYGSVHNSHSNYGGGGSEKQNNADQDGTVEGDGQGEEDQSWVTDYYRARNSFYAEEGVAPEEVDDKAENDETGSPVNMDAEGNGTEQPLAIDSIPPPPASAFDLYAAWFNEEDGVSGIADPVTSMFNTAQSDANTNGNQMTIVEKVENFFEDDEGDEGGEEEEDEEEEEDGSYYGDLSNFFGDEDEGEDGEGEYDTTELEGDEEETELEGDEEETEEKVEAAKKPAPYLAAFESSGSHHTTSLFGSTTHHLPGATGAHQTENYAESVAAEENPTIAPKSKPVQQSVSLSTEKDEDTGETFYRESIAADPIYVETKGSTDLSENKQEVFDSLQPLFTRHLEEVFGEDLIEDYTLTLTFVQSEDSVFQLRRGSAVKVYVTQLIVLVVLHLRNPDKDLVTATTTELATATVESFFDPANNDVKILLRILNDMGLHTKDIHAQDKPHPPRNKAMEHGISHVTPSNTTVDTKGDESEETVWSFTSFVSDSRTQVALIASLITFGFVFLVVLGALYHKSKADLRKQRELMLRVAGDLGSVISSRSQVSIERAKNKLKHAREKIHRSRRQGYLNLNFWRGGGSSAASIRSYSDASSTLSYIQPAAIQLRRGRHRTVAVPLHEDPLEGRQDDPYVLEDPKKPSSIYDIDINDDTDLRGVRHEVRKQSPLPDKHDYDSESSSNSGDDSSNDGDGTLASQLSRMSLDRISIARSAKAVDERNSVESQSRTPSRLETFNEVNEGQTDTDSEIGRFQVYDDSSLGNGVDPSEDDESFINRVLGGSSAHSRRESERLRRQSERLRRHREQTMAPRSKAKKEFFNNSTKGTLETLDAELAAYNSTPDRRSESTSPYNVGSLSYRQPTTGRSDSNRNSGRRPDISPYPYNHRIHESGSRLTGSTSDGIYSYETEPRSHVSRSKIQVPPPPQMPPPPSYILPGGNRRHAGPNENLQESFIPLSPLSSALQDALTASPKPLTHTASRPRTPIPPPIAARRRAVDPPESVSFTTGQYPRYGSRQMPPPTSMEEIMPDEYLNKKRWQDEEEDTTVDLPDHDLSSTAPSQFSLSTAGASLKTGGQTQSSAAGSEMDIGQTQSSAAGSEMDMTTETNLLDM